MKTESTKQLKKQPEKQKNKQVEEKENKHSKKQPEEQSNKQKKKYGLLISTIVFVILDFLAIVCLFLSYGPISYFRELLVTTAMTTQSHKYLARVLYDENTIEEILQKNFIVDIKENTNTEDIQIGSAVDNGVYESVYEEQILKRDPGNDLYKIIPLSGNNYKGYMVAIYDPSRVSLALSRYYGTKGQMLQAMSRYHGAKVAINASGFADYDSYGNGALAAGVSIQNGKIISGNGNTYGKLIGFTNDNILMLMTATANEAIASGMRDAVEFGPFLIVNGKAAEIKGNGGWGIAPRTAIAQRKDGIVLFVVIDGRQPGYSLGTNIRELTSVLLRYKAYNAANLDGGASSSLNIEGNLYSRPCAYSDTGERFLPNAWIVK